MLTPTRLPFLSDVPLRLRMPLVLVHDFQEIREPSSMLIQNAETPREAIAENQQSDFAPGFIRGLADTLNKIKVLL